MAHSCTCAKEQEEARAGMHVLMLMDKQWHSAHVGAWAHAQTGGGVVAWALAAGACAKGLCVGECMWGVGGLSPLPGPVQATDQHWTTDRGLGTFVLECVVMGKV